MPSRIRINATTFAYPNLPGNPDLTQPKSALVLSMSKFAFVAGATGAAAARLVDELLRQEWRVIGVSCKAPQGQADDKLTYLRADLLDADGLKVAISSYRDITHLFFTARACAWGTTYR